MADNEVIIKIGAVSDQFNEELEKVKKSTESLDDQLTKISKVSGIAFAALTASIGLSVAAFREQEKATNSLNKVLKNNGIFTEELSKEYQDMASSLQEVSTFGDEAIISAQAQLQQYLGNTKVTKELLQATLDLAASDGNLEGAAEKVGKAIGTSTNALAREGIELSATATKSEKYAAVIEGITKKQGGQALAATEGTGAIIQLKNSFSDITEEIGRAFAPAVETTARVLKSMTDAVKENESLVKFLAIALGVGAAGTGLIFSVTVASKVFLEFRSILIAMQAVMAASTTGAIVLSTAIRGLLIASGVGIALAALGIVLNGVFNKEETEGKAKSISDLAEELNGLEKELKAVEIQRNAMDELLDASKIPAAEIRIEELTNKIAKLKTELQSELKREDRDTVQAAKGGVDEVATERRLASEKARNERLAKLRQEDADQEYQLSLDAKTRLEELNLQFDVEREKLLNESISRKLNAQNEYNLQILALQAQLQEESLTANLTDQQLQAELDLQFQTQKIALANEQRAKLLSIDKQYQMDKSKVELQFEYDRQNIKNKIALEDLKKRKEEERQQLEDKERHGAALARIEQTFRDSNFKMARESLSNLATLTASKNKELFQIGKVASIAQAVVNIAEGVTKALAQGGILGPVLAGTVIAAGAVQLATINAQSLAQGGLVQGGVPGIDSVPAMLMPGELVVPKQNFEEVISAVQGARDGGGGAGGGPVQIELSLKNELVEFIEAKLVERRVLGFSVQGA